MESGRGSLYLHNIKDGNEGRAPSPCIPSGELTWNGMYLNKRTNSTEELQLKQDQDLQKTRDFLIRERKSETKIERMKAKKGNVADLLICLF